VPSVPFSPISRGSWLILQNLIVPGAPLLSGIPGELVNLTLLHCFRCPLLSWIPGELINLTKLNCAECPLILSIPDELVNITRLICHDCPWLSNPGDENYNSNITKLFLLQRWFRGCLMSKKLKKIYKPILEIYFHPDYKGGYLHKKSMLDQFNCINN
jgi:hypothetical protein